MNYIVGIIYVLVGVLFLFAGYRIYKSAIRLGGFLLGAVFGFVAFTLFGLGPIWALVGALLFGIIGIFFAKSVELVLFLSAGAIFGILVGLFVYPMLAQFPQWLVVGVFGLVFAVLADLLKRPTMIAGTSLAGATLTVLGTAQIITSSDMWTKFTTGTLENPKIYFIIIIVLAVMGSAIQIKHKK